MWGGMVEVGGGGGVESGDGGLSCSIKTVQKLAYTYLVQIIPKLLSLVQENSYEPVTPLAVQVLGLDNGNIVTFGLDLGNIVTLGQN